MMLLSFDFVFLPILFLKSCQFSKENHALILAIKKKKSERKDLALGKWGVGDDLGRGSGDGIRLCSVKKIQLKNS